MPSSPYEVTPPTHLPRLPESIATSRARFGFQSRTLVAVAHSFGGCTSYLAAVKVPELFDALVLVDPIIRPLYPGYTIIQPDHVLKTTDAVRRRTNWPSREEALRLFRASPFFGRWHPDALKIYVECGLYDDPAGGVSLKMSGLIVCPLRLLIRRVLTVQQEAIVFSEAMLTYETWIQADRLPDRIDLKWIMPGDTHVAYVRR